MASAVGGGGRIRRHAEEDGVQVVASAWKRGRGKGGDAWQAQQGSGCRGSSSSSRSKSASRGYGRYGGGDRRECAPEGACSAAWEAGKHVGAWAGAGQGRGLCCRKTGESLPQNARACQILVRVMLGLASSLLSLDVADDDALPRLAPLPNTRHTLNHSCCHFAHTFTQALRRCSCSGVFIFRLPPVSGCRFAPPLPAYQSHYSST